MSRRSSRVEQRHLAPETPADGAMWGRATVGSLGAVLTLRTSAGVFVPVTLATAAHAAALESIARSLRIELEQFEQRDLITGEPDVSGHRLTPYEYPETRVPDGGSSTHHSVTTTVPRS